MRLLCPWDFPGKNTRVGCHGLLQGISPTQGLNLGLLHWGGCFTIWATRQPQIYYSSLALLLEIPLESVFHKRNRLAYYNRQVLEKNRSFWTPFQVFFRLLPQNLFYNMILSFIICNKINMVVNLSILKYIYIHLLNLVDKHTFKHV